MPVIEPAVEPPFDDRNIEEQLSSNGTHKHAASLRSALHSQAPGSSPRERRKITRDSRLRSSDLGFPGKLSVRRSSSWDHLHIDCIFDVSTSVLTLPSASEFDVTCKWCASKSKVQVQNELSDSETCSSTVEAD